MSFLVKVAVAVNVCSQMIALFVWQVNDATTRVYLCAMYKLEIKTGDGHRRCFWNSDSSW